jgi:NADH:ubiquinone oxidoreductase subunit 4 (subunit M)
LAFLILFFGFYPEPLLRTVDISVSELIRNYEMDLTFYLKEATK